MDNEYTDQKIWKGRSLDFLTVHEVETAYKHGEIINNLAIIREYII